VQRKVIATVVGALIVTGCGSSPEERIARPDTKDLKGSVQVSDKSNILLAVYYSGGAAGDKTYKLLGCRLNSKRCEVLATIDSYNQAIPELLSGDGTVFLVVNRLDSISGFRNFSHDLQTDRGSVSLRYR
jgi:hypothetical protein